MKAICATERAVGNRKSMNRHQTLESIAMLAKLVPGVVDAHARHAKRTTYLWFRCDLLQSLADMADLCAAANTVIHVLAPQPAAPDRCVDASTLAFQISIPDDARVRRPSAVQILGIFMARDLKARGLLSPETSDALQRSWNAVVM